MSGKVTLLLTETILCCCKLQSQQGKQEEEEEENGETGINIIRVAFSLLPQNTETLCKLIVLFFIE